MEISADQLQSFIDLYQKKYGVILSKVDAQQKALGLLHFVSLLIGCFDDLQIDDTVLQSD